MTRLKIGDYVEYRIYGSDEVQEGTVINHYSPWWVVQSSRTGKHFEERATRFKKIPPPVDTIAEMFK